MTAPISLQQWAARWSVPAACLADLLETMGAGAIPPEPPASAPPNASEAWAQSAIRLEAPRYGIWLGRNNVGAKTWVDPKTGQKSHVRWGLANESAQQNAALKSGDLIGIRPVVITYQMVGCTIGQFVSRECKRPGWSYRGDAHETAQMNWAMLVNKYGGDAKFATGEGSFN